jgi:hypothetical protein
VQIVNSTEKYQNRHQEGGVIRHIPYPDVLLVWTCTVFGSSLKISISRTTEWPGYFVVFADNVGDALKFKILKMTWSQFYIEVWWNAHQCFCTSIWNLGAEKSRTRSLWGKREVRDSISGSPFFAFFSEYNLLQSLRFFQYHGSRFYATYHSSSSRQNILSTSYRRNTKVQFKQKSYRVFRRIDSSKLIYRLTIKIWYL